MVSFVVQNNQCVEDTDKVRLSVVGPRERRYDVEVPSDFFEFHTKQTLRDVIGTRIRVESNNIPDAIGVIVNTPMSELIAVDVPS